MSILAIAIIVVGEIVHQEKEVIAPIKVDPDLIANQDKNIETIASIETIDHVHMTKEKAQTSETTNTHLINDKTIDTGLGVTHLPEVIDITKTICQTEEDSNTKTDQAVGITHSTRKHMPST